MAAGGEGEDKKEWTRRRKSVCFRTGARDHGGSSVGEREVSLFSGSSGEEQVG